MRNFLLQFFATLLMVGCKMSSDRLDDENASNSPGSQKVDSLKSFTISGRVNKGIVRLANVEVFHFNEADPWLYAPIGKGVTDENGRFSVDIPSVYMGQPAYIRVSGSSGQSSMVCDLVGGCNGVEFGGAVPIDASFDLSLALPALQRSKELSVTLLTHVGASMVNDALRSVGEESLVSVPVDLARVQYEIGQIYSRLASRFGIIGDIASLDVVDLTSEQEVANADSRELWYALMGPGIWHASRVATQSDIPVSQMTQFFTQFYSVAGLSSSFKESGIEDLLAYEQVLEGTYQTAEFLQLNMASAELSGLLAEISTSLGLLKAEPVNSSDFGTAAATITLTDLEKAKHLMRDISQVTASVNLPRLISLANISRLLDPKASAAIDQFGFELSVAQIIEGQRSDSLISGLLKMIQTAINVVVMSTLGEDIPSSIDGVFFTHNVNLTLSGEYAAVHSFTFSQPIEVCFDDVASCYVIPNIRLEIKYGKIGLPQNENNKIGFDPLVLSIEGEMIVDLLEASFNLEGQKLEFKEFILSDELRGVTNENEDITHLKILSGATDISLPISIHYKGDDNSDPLTLSAKVLASSGNVALELFDKSETYLSSGEEVTLDTFEATIHTLEQFNVSLGAEVVNQNEDKSVVLALGARQTNVQIREPIQYLSMTKKVCPEETTDPGQCRDESPKPIYEGESEDSFLSLAASIGFKANLKGLQESVVLEISGERESPETNRIDRMKLRYPGQSISLQGTFRTGKVNNKAYMESLDAVGLDGTRMQIKSDTSGNRSGKISNSLEEQIAEITDMGEWLNIRFENGDFESFCRC